MEFGLLRSCLQQACLNHSFVFMCCKFVWVAQLRNGFPTFNLFVPVWTGVQHGIISTAHFTWQERNAQHVKDSVRIHEARRKEKTQERHVVNSPKKIKIYMICRARIACYRLKMRLQKQKAKFEEELLESQKKLQNLDGGNFDHLSKAYLLSAQSLLLKEGIVASQTRAKQGRRQTDDWLLPCP